MVRTLFPFILMEIITGPAESFYLQSEDIVRAVVNCSLVFVQALKQVKMQITQTKR